MKSNKENFKETKNQEIKPELLDIVKIKIKDKSESFFAQIVGEGGFYETKESEEYLHPWTIRNLETGEYYYIYSPNFKYNYKRATSYKYLPDELYNKVYTPNNFPETEIVYFGEMIINSEQIIKLDFKN